MTTTDTGIETTASPRSSAGSSTDGSTEGADLGLIHEVAESLIGAMTSVIEGKPDVVRTAVTVLLAEGHLLIEDVPGVGKTMLAKTLARSIDCTVRRIQFTPDLLPSDVTGVSVFNQDARATSSSGRARSSRTSSSATRSTARRPRRSRRCSSRWRSARSRSTGRPTRCRPPFIVMATQNPIEMEGTYPLPEAQRDRFMARISMGYPAPECRARPARRPTARSSPLDDLRPVTDAATITRVIDVGPPRPREPGGAPVRRRPRDAPAVDPDLRLGASPGRPCTCCGHRARLRRARGPRPRAARRRAEAGRARPRAPPHAVERDPARPSHHRRGGHRPAAPGAGAAAAR